MKVSFLFLLVVCITTADISAQCIKGNCQNGIGTLVYESGSRYEGQFKGGRPHGDGQLIYSNKDVYKGQFANGRREGLGELKTSVGERYSGQFVAGKMKGEGHLYYPNGDDFVGDFDNDLPNGFGKYTFADKDYYEGEIKDGVFTGQGTMIYQNGNKYVGQWLNNEKNGTGTFTFANGTKQTGQWTNGELANAATAKPTSNTTAQTKPSTTTTKPTTSTKPTTTQSNNSTALKNCNVVHCASGKGYFVYGDGSRWEGEFKAGYPFGQGVMNYSDKSRYEGAFADHAPHGEGVMYYPSGRVVGAIWDHGMPTTPLDAQPVSTTTADVRPELNPQIKVWAVVVGVGRYLTMPTLKYTDDDAYQLFAFLKSPEGGALPDNQIRVLIDDDATRNNILLALQEILGKADANDVVMFYFSGHGIDGAFLPVDYDGFNNSLTHKEIKQVLDKSKARYKVCIADACHSGSLLASRDAAQQAATVQRLYDAFAVSSGGTALLMSSKSEEYSLEDQGLRSGIFSHFLIKGLRGAADKNGNKIVDVTELYEYTNSQVRTYTQGIQTPVISGKFDPKMPISSIR